MNPRPILVTGGAGFIGSHVARTLFLKGYHPIILDNLSNGNKKSIPCGTFIKGDLANLSDLNKVFNNYDIQAVMHFSAYINVGESVTDPAKYYINNVSNSINLFEAMRMHDVKTMIFSSTASIFGVPVQLPMNENHPCNPINPYGETKLFVEKILANYADAYHFKYSALRYFNAAGGDSSGKVKNYKEKETNIIPLILKSLHEPNPSFTIHGTDYSTPDGTCLRDYIHVEDIASAHILAMERLFSNHPSSNYNLGNERGHSVRDVIAAIEKVTGFKINVIEGPRRIGDPPILIADSEKARKELGWSPQHPELESIITDAWNAISDQRIRLQSFVHSLQ